MSVGYEHIDLQACQERGVSVTNTPNVSTDSVAELTVSLVLLTARRLLEGVLLEDLCYIYPGLIKNSALTLH